MITIYAIFICTGLVGRESCQIMTYNGEPPTWETAEQCEAKRRQVQRGFEHSPGGVKVVCMNKSVPAWQRPAP